MTATIMVVDDSRSILKMLLDTLSKAGYTVITALNGQEAVELLIDQKIDMLITDYLMPEMDGLQLTRTVRSMSDFKDIPILFLSTESEKTQQKAAKEAGATGWAVKPFDPQQILLLTAELLKRTL